MKSRTITSFYRRTRLFVIVFILASCVVPEIASAAPELQPARIEEPLAANEVYVIGEVAKPGKYSVSSETKLETLISQAGGFAANAKLGMVQLSRIDAKGTKTLTVVDCRPGPPQSIDVPSASTTNIRPGDVIFVPSAIPVKPKPKDLADGLGLNEVRVVGHVESPGVYTIPEKGTVLDIIRMAKSFTSAAKSNAVEVIRKDSTGKKTKIVVDCNAWDKEVPPGKPNGLFPVEPKDVIFVPEAPR